MVAALVLYDPYISDVGSISDEKDIFSGNYGDLDPNYEPERLTKRRAY